MRRHAPADPIRPIVRLVLPSIRAIQSSLASIREVFYLPAPGRVALRVRVSGMALLVLALGVASLRLVVQVQAGPGLPAASGSAWIGVTQVYVARADGSNPVCLSCAPTNPNAPAPDRYKNFPSWRPQGDWIALVAEMPVSATCPAPNCPLIPLSTADVQLRQEMGNGYWGNLYVTNADGSQWYQLTSYALPTGNSRGMFGVLAPHFSPDGSKIAWDQIYQVPDPPPAGTPLPPAGCPLGTTYHAVGYWNLFVADFVVSNGVPSLQNVRYYGQPNPTCGTGYWYEAQGWSPDGTKLALSSDLNQPNTNQYGQDVFVLDLTTGQFTNLTNSPSFWDEHAFFSPGATKIAFGSTSPYPSLLTGPLGLLPWYQLVADLTMEYMLMDANGQNVQQLTYFNSPVPPPSSPAHPEWSPGQVSLAVDPQWSVDGARLLLTQGIVNPLTGFPTSGKQWLVTFAGACGFSTGATGACTVASITPYQNQPFTAASPSSFNPINGLKVFLGVPGSPQAFLPNVQNAAR